MEEVLWLDPDFALWEKFSCHCSLYTLVLPSDKFFLSHCSPRLYVKWGAALLGDYSVLTACFLLGQVWRSKCCFMTLFILARLVGFWQYSSLKNFSGLSASKQFLVTEIMPKDFNSIYKYQPSFISLFLYAFFFQLNGSYDEAMWSDWLNWEGNTFKLFLAIGLNSSV